MIRLPFDLPALQRLLRFATKRITEDRIAQVAGSLTFTTVLSVVPLITVAFAVFTAFPIFSSFQNALQGFLSDRLMPPAVNEQIFGYLNEFAAKAKGLTTAGLIALLVTSLITLLTIESALNVIWRVPRPRPLAQRILSYWALLTVGPLLFGVSASLSSYLFSESLWANATPLSAPLFGKWALAFATLPLTTLGFTLLYVYLPNCRVEWRDALVGGVVAALAFEVAKRGFGFYVRRFPTYTAVYGTFAAIPIFLLWVYLGWFITLFCAMVTAVLPDIRSGYHFRPRFTGSDLSDALGVLARLALARERGRDSQKGYTATELARMLRRDFDTTNRLLISLEQRNWIARLDQPTRRQRWVLIAHPRMITVDELLDVFVIDRSELSYQLGLDSSRIDGKTLLAALRHESLKLSLQDLIAARSAPPHSALPAVPNAREADSDVSQNAAAAKPP